MIGSSYGDTVATEQDTNQEERSEGIPAGAEQSGAQQHSGRRRSSGNFANDRKRAAEAGRKGGMSRGRSS